MGGPDLIAASGAKGLNDQRSLDLAQHPIVEPGRRQAPLVGGEVVFDMPFDRARKSISTRRFERVSRYGQVSEFRLDHVDADNFLRIECRQPPNQVLKLADIPGPAIGASAEKCLTSARMSAVRSRSAGNRIGATLRR